MIGRLHIHVSVIALRFSLQIRPNKTKKNVIESLLLTVRRHVDRERSIWLFADTHWTCCFFSQGLARKLNSIDGWGGHAPNILSGEYPMRNPNMATSHFIWLTVNWFSKNWLTVVIHTCRYGAAILLDLRVGTWLEDKEEEEEEEKEEARCGYIGCCLFVSLCVCVCLYGYRFLRQG